MLPRIIPVMLILCVVSILFAGIALATCCANEALGVLVCEESILTEDDCCNGTVYEGYLGFSGFPKDEQDCRQHYFSDHSCTRIASCNELGCCCDDLHHSAYSHTTKNRCIMENPSEDGPQFYRFLPGTVEYQACFELCGYGHTLTATTPLYVAQYQEGDDHPRILPTPWSAPPQDSPIYAPVVEVPTLSETNQSFGKVLVSKTAPKSATIGDKITIRITIISNSSERMRLTVEETFGSFVDYAGSDLMHRKAGAYEIPYLEYPLMLEPKASAELVYQVVPRKSGEHYFSPAVLISDDGTRYETNPVKVTVNCRQEKDCMICSLGQACEPTRAKWYWTYAAGGLVVVLIIILIYDLEKRRSGV
jgi:hypothetical protein